MTTSAPVVCVVDDDDSLRTAIARLLTASGYRVRAYASAGEFLLDDVGPGPTCLVLDVQMPGPSGLDLQQALEKREQPLPIVFLTGHGDIPMSVRAMRAGATDFLTKPVKRDVLLAAVQAALARDAERRAGSEQLRMVRARFETLTAREREVFGRVVHGLLNKQIAAEMGCSIRTVKIHRARAMEKMQAGSLADLVRAAELLRSAAALDAPVPTVERPKPRSNTI
jgi:FixJ family two-component response regulator